MGTRTRGTARRAPRDEQGSADQASSTDPASSADPGTSTDPGSGSHRDRASSPTHVTPSRYL
jgi:hypothetical protein